MTNDAVHISWWLNLSYCHTTGKTYQISLQYKTATLRWRTQWLQARVSQLVISIFFCGIWESFQSSKRIN